MKTTRTVTGGKATGATMTPQARAEMQATIAEIRAEDARRENLRAHSERGREMHPKARAEMQAAIAKWTDKGGASQLAYLYERWGDESKYEDWQGYEEVMRSYMPKGMEFLRGTKRPFGFHCKISTHKGQQPVFVGCKRKGDSIGIYLSYLPKWY